MMADTNRASTFPAQLGMLLCRAVVPAWVLTGAIFKLVEATPRNLPPQIVKAAKTLDIDLALLLATLISIEIVFAAAMIFLARFARAAAILILSVFCAVLIIEMATGNMESCGCLGNVPITPWQMLIIDGSLLVGVALLRPRRIELLGQPQWGVIAALVVAMVGAGAAFKRIVWVDDFIPADTGGLVTPPKNGDTLPPAPPPLPRMWYVASGTLEGWIGKPWREVDLIRYMTVKPAIADEGTHYVVFYKRSCEHCEEMFQQDFDRLLPVPIAAVQIPENQTTLMGADPWPMPWETPPANVELLALPVGPDWVITPPLALRIENGIVACAIEGETYRTCFNFNF